MTKLYNGNKLLLDTATLATKTEVATLKSNTYTKAETDAAIATGVSNLVDLAPETLDTLSELADALGNDPNFATTIATQLGKKANSTDVYTKTETNNLLDEKADVATTLAGYGITDGVNAVTVTGSGNAVTSASVSGHSLKLSKDQVFLGENATRMYANQPGEDGYICIARIKIKSSYMNAPFMFLITHRYMSYILTLKLNNTEGVSKSDVNSFIYDVICPNTLYQNVAVCTKEYDADTNTMTYEIYIRKLEWYDQFGVSLINYNYNYMSVQGKTVIEYPSTFLPTRPDGVVATPKEQYDQNIDWYGVSWSDAVAAPACTRIGNMTLHKELPIQSKMRGCCIFPETGLIKYFAEDGWSTRTFEDGTALSDNYGVSGSYGCIMVEIPEYWYIDEYDASTETHNLKLSEHAKAGWHHHKKAYVGAYEGYIHEDENGTRRYMSRRNVYPTVNVTRDTIRTTVRVHGSNAWNIYTYEEHKAICHLFLVEYATRNSQASINSTLNLGFKQGGLGSGCTTGTAQINGVETWSIVPCGVTDTLGNGTGQVSYTVAQTDADGNALENKVVTPNRYRGIENPFGHIWKHVDDVTSVGDNTYRYYYKCDDPNYFTTNKDSHYKLIARGYQGTNTTQGYKKAITPTTAGDIFTKTIGASTTTYWCDYNYDIEGTNERCLLVGGSSGSGSLAGLFYLSSHYAASYSYPHVGSRIVYYPQV